MVEQMEHRFEALVNLRRGAEPRHATLRAAMDWSYMLLSPELQRFFARLSVFRGGWTVEAAETVCEDQRTLDSLSQLLGYSLVHCEEAAGGMRFQMLETLREYGWEQLSGEEQAMLRKKHAHYYLGLVDRTQGEYWGRHANPGPWLDRLELEHNNLRAALDWALTSPWLEDLGNFWLGPLSGFWNMRGHQREGRRWLTDLLRTGDLAQPTHNRSMALGDLGGILSRLGDLEALEAVVREQLAIDTEAGLQVDVALERAELGDVLCRKGRIDDALPLYRQALSTLREKGAWIGCCSCLEALSEIALYHGDTDRAEAHCREHLETLHEHGVETSCQILTCQGRIAVCRGDYGLALEMLRRVLLENREIGNIPEQAERLCDFAELAARQGQASRAARLIGAADAIADSLGIVFSWRAAETHAITEEAARAILGDDGFAVEYACGRSMSRSDALTAALGE
jgi:non-specific serine/threonine protein kinase